MNDISTPRELEWDDEISGESSGFILLEDGDYDFTVTAFERGRFPGSTKIPACKKAVFTLAVETSQGIAYVKHDLILWSTLQWRIAEFFQSIGQGKKGEPLRPRWSEVVGACGRARFKTRTYTKRDGTEGKTNDVERFYDYDSVSAQTHPQTWTSLPSSTPTPWTGGGK